MPDASVIIPCYNQGLFVHEAIDSVLSQTHRNIEIIVVNDGSTDQTTNTILKNIQHPLIQVLHTQNQGLASARNNGIKQAQSEIILPLDADDKIHPMYIEKALMILKNSDDIGIVYCIAELFGEKRGIWRMPEFSMQRMLLGNLIFHCAFFRRSDWERVNGYNATMIYGWEDWDFWLSILSLGRSVYRIPEVLHYYRMRKESMVHTMTEERMRASRTQVFLNHQELYRQQAYLFFDEIGRLEKKAYRSIVDRIINDNVRHPIEAIRRFFHRFDPQP